MTTSVKEGSRLRWLRERIQWRWVALAFGAALLTWLIIDFGPAQLARRLFDVGPGFLLMPLVYALGSGLRAFGWRVLITPLHRPSLRGTVESRFAAGVLNESLPLLGLGGEPTRLLWLSKASRGAGTSALILDRVLVLVADALYLLAVATIAVTFLPLPDTLFKNAALCIAVSLTLSASLVLLTFKKGLATPVILVIGKLGFFSQERLDKARAIDATVREVWSHHPKRILLALGIQLGSRLLMSMEIWIGLSLLGARAGFADALIVSVVPLAVSVAFAFIPSQIGVMAAANALVFKALGLDPALGVALALLQNLRQLAIFPFGFICLARAPHLQRRQQQQRQCLREGAIKR
ncbi:MAG: flippase-like domain-containing protein [Myxococcales bacterium]|nr:flippase-like domain-containing protein [Myxococcales bacterium]